ncbi:RNA-guided endonuclease InsQ/TnpB family protein [Actinomadura adrarensis]|uniref:RNA-guided endonuclease InsQ/TnpB family protein n=1 Tax=Actinomadura adrarensis TaxID=1819600 RepID=A0ABW3CAF4_9ACTN
MKAGQKAGYPRFKGGDRFDTVEWPKDGDGCRWNSQPEHPTATYVRLQGIGHVRVVQHRPVQGTVKTISVKREGRRWYVVLSCDDVPERPLPATGRQVGVDLGVARFATTSDGEIVGNPRADFHHKTARALIASCDVIAVEKLNVAGMTRSAAGTVDAPGVNVAAKSGLNRSILDAGWARFVNILTGKAEEAGRRIVFVNPARTSIDCHRCGTRCTRPRQDTVICPACGPIDADTNGARNIATRAGLGSGQAAA